eukprot:3932580-Rhodomonas_salina.1
MPVPHTLAAYAMPVPHTLAAYAMAVPATCHPDPSSSHVPFKLPPPLCPPSPVSELRPAPLNVSIAAINGSAGSVNGSADCRNGGVAEINRRAV